MAQSQTLSPSEDPLSAKLRFRFRTLINCLLVLGIFVIVQAFNAIIVHSWLVEFMTIGLLFYLFFYILEKRAIGMRCRHCNKHIRTNTPWVCGFKECVNVNVDKYPFVHCCEECGAEPKAYKCHHCGEIIFLSADEQPTNFARCLNAPAEVKADDTTVKSQGRQEEKVSKEHALAMAELDEKLKVIKERIEGAKIRPVQEKVAEEFERIYSRTMGPREYARKKKAEVAEMYKNDPVALEDANEAIADALRKLS